MGQETNCTDGQSANKPILDRRPRNEAIGPIGAWPMDRWAYWAIGRIGGGQMVQMGNWRWANHPLRKMGACLLNHQNSRKIAHSYSKVSIKLDKIGITRVTPVAHKSGTYLGVAHKSTIFKRSNPYRKVRFNWKKGATRRHAQLAAQKPPNLAYTTCALALRRSLFE